MNLQFTDNGFLEVTAFQVFCEAMENFLKEIWESYFQSIKYKFLNVIDKFRIYA